MQHWQERQAVTMAAIHTQCMTGTCDSCHVPGGNDNSTGRVRWYRIIKTTILLLGRLISLVLRLIIIIIKISDVQSGELCLTCHVGRTKYEINEMVIYTMICTVKLLSIWLLQFLIFFSSSWKSLNLHIFCSNTAAERQQHGLCSDWANCAAMLCREDYYNVQTLWLNELNSQSLYIYFLSTTVCV